ncbi:YfjI family protein [Fluviibacter phosphoraccumulans]|uniref:YfjI family protein n=1 Tax=Fluviibacter phosphoraccumulans TaxID=1751046 RepID=UPI0024E1FAD1|nr:YfjI family protein [Fluviibacter phosphoraccumulans]
MNSNHGQDQDDPFPLHRLPLEVREVVENLNFRTEIPIPAIALVVFGALSVATQERIRIRKRESLISPVTLWMLVALGSGERKTTLINEVMKSLREFEDENQKKAEDVKHEFQASLELHRAKKREVARLMREAIRNGESTDGLVSLSAKVDREKPEMPRIKKLVHEDASAAALIQSLAERSASTSIISDEFGFLASGRALDRLSLLCKAYDGSEISVERKNAASVRIKDPLVSLVLLGQNKIIDEFVTKNWKRLEPSGFLSRFFVIASDSNVGNRLLRTATPANPKVFEAFHRRIRALLEASHGATGPKVLRFDAEAQRTWDAYHDHIEGLMQAGRYYERVRPFASRLADKAARLAAILHYAYDGAGDVPCFLLEAAIELTDWYARAYVSIFGLYCLEIDEKNGVLLAQWILKRYGGLPYYDFKMDFLQQNVPPSIRRKALLEPTISQLAESQCVERLLDIRGKPFIRFHINAVQQYLVHSGVAPEVAPSANTKNGYGHISPSLVHYSQLGPMPFR